MARLNRFGMTREAYRTELAEQRERSIQYRMTERGLTRANAEAYVDLVHFFDTTSKARLFAMLKRAVTNSAVSGIEPDEAPVLVLVKLEQLKRMSEAKDKSVVRSRGRRLDEASESVL